MSVRYNLMRLAALTSMVAVLGAAIFTESYRPKFNLTSTRRLLDLVACVGENSTACDPRFYIRNAPAP